MAEVADQTPSATSTESDLIAAVRQALQNSEEPLTLSKLRAALPTSMRGISLEALEESLRRQVAANVLYQYPKYRSQQNRYWDRPMRVHLTYLLVTAVQEKPLSLSDLRRKLPDYAKTQADAVLEEEMAEGRLHRHPPVSSRSGPRYGAERPNPRDYLQDELRAVFAKLRPHGFTDEQLRAGALELLHDEEWADSLSQPAEQAKQQTPEGGAAAQAVVTQSAQPEKTSSPPATPAPETANQGNEP